MGMGHAAARIDKHGQPFVIREIEPEDRRGLERMYEGFEPKRVAQGLPPGTPEQQRRWLDDVLPRGHHLVVEIEGDLIGHGMLLPFDGDAAELANFLHQSIRDRGIGTALNQALLDLGRAHGMSRIWLSVEPSNRRAVRSYEKVGFRRLPMPVFAPELEMEARLEATGQVS